MWLRVAPGLEASMRPRHEASENPWCRGRPRCAAGRFNEAEARSLGERAAPRSTPPSTRSFNEAEARSLGEPAPIPGGRQPSHRFNEAEARSPGERGRGAEVVEHGHASMRPRHEASENGEGPQDLDARPPASMRPRHEASENPTPSPCSRPGWGCFNEAEARSLGEPHHRPRLRAGRPASMRPRHEASENQQVVDAVVLCVFRAIPDAVPL